MSSNRRQARDLEVEIAIHDRSLDRLQHLSLRAGGFGNVRREAWTFLLEGSELPISELDSVSTPSVGDPSLLESWTQPAVSPSTSPKSNTTNSIDSDSFHMSDEHVYVSSHPDSHQVQLDTNRSFILYPVEYPSVNFRKSLQTGLHDTILGVLQKRPKLRYFQGYHDIITVLFLTLPEEKVLPCAEKLSLHRLRDSMGSGLDPLVGQLRVLKRLLRLIDPQYAEVLERNSPLPYYALSNLLTLFSHDVPTLPLIQHVFDWLLCREPIAVIWLAAAVILRRKEDVLALERGGDEAAGMMHAVLSALPALSEVESSLLDAELQEPDPSELRVSSDRTAGNSVLSKDNKEKLEEEDNPDISDCDDTAEKKSSLDTFDTEEGDVDAKDGMVPSLSDSLLDSWTTDMPRSTNFSPAPIGDSILKLDSDTSKSIPVTAQLTEDGIGTDAKPIPDGEVRHSRRSATIPSRSRSGSSPGFYREKDVPRVPLTSILCKASELLVTYPPSSPALCIADTFGPQSALHLQDSSSRVLVFTLSDDEAEACVGGDKVVFQPAQEEQEQEISPPKKPKQQISRFGANKSGLIRLGKVMVARRRTIMAGAVLLLGVAAAFYGFGATGRGHLRNGHKFAVERRVFAWVGGLLGLGREMRIFAS